MIRASFAIALTALGLAGGATGCVMVDSGDQINVVGPSGKDFATQFPPLGAFLVHRCGSLDCHGEVGRNLRIYGKDGLRLDPHGLTNGSPTSADEYEADYRSVVALEPGDHGGGREGSRRPPRAPHVLSQAARARVAQGRPAHRGG